MITAKIGDLAYHETLFHGLIPCRTLAARVHPTCGHVQILVKLTADRGAYKRGELNWRDVLNVIPRPAIHKPRGCYFPRIRAYRWEQ